MKKARSQDLAFTLFNPKVTTTRAKLIFCASYLGF